MRIIGRTHLGLVGALGARWNKVNLVMCIVYIDDSGSRPNHKIAIATALIIPGSKIPALDLEWEELKNTRGFSCFHASPCNARDKDSDFSHWRTKQVDRAFSGVRKISKKYGIEAISAALLKKDYNEVVPSTLKRYTGRHHYTWCASHAIAFLKTLGIEKSKPCEYFFDHMDQNDPARVEIQNMMEYNHRAAGERAIESDYRHVWFRDKREVPGLQCVDEIAWTCNQYALYRLGVRTYIPKRAKNSWNYYGGGIENGWLKAFTFKRTSLQKWVDETLRDGRTLAQFDRWEKEDLERKSEYGRFERTVTDLLQVPHAEIKEKLDAEKNAKKRKKSRASSASREAGDR